MTNGLNLKIEKHDKVCWNCDMFIRDVNSYYGMCALKDARKKNDEDACKHYGELVEDIEREDKDEWN